MYHWNARARGVARVIVNRIHVPIVSSFRKRARNNSAANQTIRITLTYAQPCQARAMTLTHSPARSAYKTLWRFSRKKVPRPAVIDVRRNQFSTQRLRFIVFSARRKKQNVETTNNSVNASGAAAVGAVRWR